jgi:PAS domain S-box-containing protein
LNLSRPDTLEYSFAQVLNSFNEILVITDANLNIEFANNAFLALTSLPKDEVIHKSLYDFFAKIHTWTDELSRLVAGQTIVKVTLYAFSNVPYQLGFTGLYDTDNTITGYTISIKEQSESNAENKHQNKYQALFNDVQEGIIILDNESRILEVNPAACEIFQLESKVFQTLLVRYLFPHNSEEESDRLWDKFITKGSMSGYYKFALPNGEFRYIEFKAKTDFIEGQHLAVFTDVSDKKTAQEELKTSEYQLKALFDSTSQVIFLLDKQLRILRLNNKASINITQYSGIEDLVGKSILDIFPSLLDSPSEAEYYLNRVFQGETVSFERNFPRNSPNWFDVALSPVYNNNNNEIRSICIVCQDSTLRKKTELSLATSEARFRSLVQNSSDLIAILDKEGKVSYSSSSFFKILGYTDSFLKNKNLSDLIIEDDRAEFSHWLENSALSDQETHSLEFRILHADGHYVYLESIFNNQISDPFIDGIILNARDVTVRKFHENSLLLLERAINSSNNGIFITDSAVNENPIIYANKAFEKITGYKKDEIEGEGFLKFVGLESKDTETIVANKNEEIRAGSVLVENTRNGFSYWSELNISPVYTKSQVQSNFIGVINDVTEKKKADDALKEIVNGMASVSETDFFETLVSYLESSIGCDVVFIAETTSTRKLVTRAMLYDGEKYEPTVFETRDAPWYKVIKEKNSIYTYKLFEDFPEADFFPSNFTCFCGVPLYASNGEVIGVLGVANRGAFADFEFGKSLLKLFSVRTSAELNRQKYLKTLTISESKFRALAANSPDLILIYNLNDRFVEYINRQEFLGYSYKEISNDTVWMNAYHPAYFPKAQKQLIRAIKGELPVDNNEDLLIVRKDGQMEWITNRISILEKKDNWISKVLITATIITERKDAEEALRKSDDRLKALTENTNDLLFSIDKSLVFTAMNTAFKEFVGKNYKQKVDIGQHVSTVFNVKYNNLEWIDLLHESLDDKKMVREIYIDSELGDEYFEVLLNPIRQGAKNVLGVSVFARDITRRIKAENDIKRTNFELDSFVYRASHDLRAPLRSVLGLLNLIEHENEAVARQEYLVLAHKSINKLDSFISDLTDFTRNSRLDIKPVEIDFERLVDDTFERLQFMDNASRIKVIKKIDYRTFASDIIRVSIIVQNLISNAIKYQNEYLDTSFVEVGLQYLKPNLVEIWIRDNGRGIRPEFHDKVFDMFYRASSDSNGSGLGLYITKQVVEKLKGSIKLKSDTSVGTEIRIELPIIESLDDQVGVDFQ